MTISIVMQYSYEGDFICGIYASREPAEAHAAVLRAQPAAVGVSVDVEDWQVLDTFDATENPHGIGRVEPAATMTSS